ncbi:hypothetical protein [Bacillus xiapuensis]|uniref:hypothetical protein n=1 Tax=Bacillus xiapuensis TaxID=2014075 RepID=UPI0012FE5514|nr:hypothetical protein [Bacillus xiapuensis]
MPKRFGNWRLSNKVQLQTAQEGSPSLLKRRTKVVIAASSCSAFVICIVQPRTNLFSCTIMEGAR